MSRILRSHRIIMTTQKSNCVVGVGTYRGHMQFQKYFKNIQREPKKHAIRHLFINEYTRAIKACLFCDICLLLTIYCVYGDKLR